VIAKLSENIEAIPASPTRTIPMATKTSAKALTVVNDFHVLPLSIPPSSSYPHKALHYLYVRANTPKVPTEDTPREVFLVNIPIDATELHIRSLFADQLGGPRIEKVAFEGARVGKGINAPVAPATEGKKRKRIDEALSDETSNEEVGLLPEICDRSLHHSGGTAIATFVDKTSAELAIKEVRKAIKSKRDIQWGAGIAKKLPSLGSARYLNHHRLRFPDAAVLQSSVDAYMDAFTAREELRAKMLAKQRNEPDEDGFITVTRGGRSGPAKEEETRAKEEELKKRQQNMVKGDFYRFQTREKKKEQAQDLVRGFEEDRKRLEEMKRRRGKLRPE
jgi:ribosomal RNA-processing protein 7